MKKKIVVILAIAALLLSGCTPHKGKVKPKSEIPPIKSILMMQVKNMAEVYGENKEVRMPFSGGVYKTGPIIKNGPTFLTSQVQTQLSNLKDIGILPPSQTRTGMTDLTTGQKNSQSEREIVVNAGRTVNADAVLAGYLYKATQRIGNELGAKTPASVSFSLYLVDTKTGRTIWEAYYEETQKPLSENLLNIVKFIKRKGSWVTAQRLMELGVADCFKDFPYENDNNTSS